MFRRPVLHMRKRGWRLWSCVIIASAASDAHPPMEPWCGVWPRVKPCCGSAKCGVWPRVKPCCGSAKWLL
eukprot:3314379-Amphidinium_carterae.1